MKLMKVFAAGLSLLSFDALAQSAPSMTQFELHPNPAFLPCLSANGFAPQATVTVKRGKLNDQLTLDVSGLKPNLAFDLFTVQRSSLKANGEVVPAADFPGFGLAWYQTDVQADSGGDAHVVINTILLDQIFGFDADKLTTPDTTVADPSATNTTVLVPTHTFHVGFWFNNPADAASCGFNVATPTPFNGEQKAGPLAMISVPDAKTNLGPLCTQPSSESAGATCNE